MMNPFQRIRQLSQNSRFKLLIGNPKRTLNRLAAKLVYALPIFAKYSPRNKLTTFRNWCKRVEKFPARCEETSQNSWYITLQKSETVHRNLPIRLSNDVDIAQSRWTLPPHNLYGYEYQVPDAFLACVPKARLLIPGSGLLGSDFLVLSQRNNIFTDSTWSIPGFLDSNDATGILLYPRIRYCPEAYGILGIRLWEAYYHWMIEILPRLSLFEQIEELRSIPLIVPKGMKNFHKESLKLAGVSSDRLVELDSGYWQFEKLYFPSLLNEMANPSPHAVAWLRTRFLKNITHEPSSQSYIYMKRGSQIRKIVNEDELVECLEKRGFQVVCPGELSLAEQIKIFSNARIVVGAHGADFTNMVFAPPNTTIIELHPSRYIIPCFWGLASLCRHRYAYLIGPSVSNENYGGLTNFYISLDKLQMLLDKVMNME